MALPPIPTTEDSFIREVDEELRRDRLTGLWQRYGRWAIAAICLSLAVLAGWLIWQDRSFKAASAESEVLDDAMRQASTGNNAAALKALDGLTASDNEGYRASAALTKAAIL